jgi:hypothetical protein
MRRVRSFPYIRRQSANALAVLAVLVAVGAFAAPAFGAGTKIEVEPRFQLDGSDGYRLQISARAATVTIGVSRTSDTPHAGSSTTYVARGTAGPNGIHANFHQFGKIEMKFHRTAEAVRGLPPDCFGGTTGAATIPGYFSGTIEFEGQKGYTAVHSHRVRGEVVLPPTEQCPLVAGGANPLVEDPSAELPPAKTRMTLTALEKSGTGGLDFVARRAGKTGFYAESFTTVGRIGLLSYAYALGPRSTFTSDPQVSHGVVNPPKPFVGTGTLQRGPHGRRTWAGTLATTFPGEGRVSLVGTQFHTTLARSFP